MGLAFKNNGASNIKKLVENMMDNALSKHAVKALLIPDIIEKNDEAVAAGINEAVDFQEKENITYDDFIEKADSIVGNINTILQTFMKNNTPYNNELFYYKQYSDNGERLVNDEEMKMVIIDYYNEKKNSDELGEEIDKYFRYLPETFTNDFNLNVFDVIYSILGIPQSEGVRLFDPAILNTGVKLNIDFIKKTTLQDLVDLDRCTASTVFPNYINFVEYNEAGDEIITPLEKSFRDAVATYFTKPQNDEEARLVLEDPEEWGIISAKFFDAISLLIQFSVAVKKSLEENPEEYQDKMKETIVGLSATLLVLGRLTNIYVIVTDAIAEFHRNKDSLIVKMLDKMSEEL